MPPQTRSGGKKREDPKAQDQKQPPKKRQRREEKPPSDPPRSDRIPASRSAPDGPDGDDTSRSVLGGMADGFRLTGDETTSDGDGITGFKVPFEDKGIVCQLYHGSSKLEDGDQKASLSPRLIFTHGAGGGIANPATVDFAKGFADAAPVLCFQGTMNLQSRVKTFNAVVEHVRGKSGTEPNGKATKPGKEGRQTAASPRLALGGRSMGARAACIAAQQIKGIDTLVLVSYPLKSEKGDIRDEVLYEISAKTRVLFVSGDGDKMCDLDELETVRKRMKARSTVCVVKGADHGMSLKGGKEHVQETRNKSGAVAADFVVASDGCIWPDPREI